MTLEEKKSGKELMIMGYAFSLRTMLRYNSDHAQLNPGIIAYPTTLPKELMVVNKFYRTNVFAGPIREDFGLKEIFGFKFALQHKTSKFLFIEPFTKTELIGFPEFYHKKTDRWYWRLMNWMSSLSSTDPFITYDLSSSILFEGDYVTAFGLVSYHTSDDSFSMTKPLALVKGGIDALRDFFQIKKTEKVANAYVFTILAMVATVGCVASFYTAKHFYKKVRTLSEDAKKGVVEIENLT
jgi:hypothetical protein